MRRAGLLAHPSSLPGPGPSGDLGQGTLAFLDWLSDCGIGLWQVLPLGPVDAGFCPYASPSAFAGGSHLLSLDTLVEDGLLEPQEARFPTQVPERVSPALVDSWHRPRAECAARRLATGDPSCLEAFRRAHPWVEDWSVYRALLSGHGVSTWQELPPRLAARDPGALASAVETHAEKIDQEVALQVLFFRQWETVRAHARKRGITVLGDVPIFVASGSCDVWAGRHRFRGRSDPQRTWVPDPVTGVPPDFFSPDGQCWGNPHYDWPAHQAEDFSWWVARLEGLLSLVDEVRIDHFRGLVSAWEIPHGAASAKEGAWAPGPGRALLDTLLGAVGRSTLFVEDLGDITPDVHALRDALGLPGMKILQFAFNGDPDHPFKPHNWTHPRWVAYTGTHDNNTSRGWYEDSDPLTQHRFRVYVDRSGEEPQWDLIRLAWSSIAATAVTQLQDVLGLGSPARLNVPGTPTGNWTWRTQVLPDRLASQRLRDLTERYGRRKPEAS